MYNHYVSGRFVMKKIFFSLHRSSKAVLVIGAAAMALVLFASTVLFVGAGRVFDYYPAVEISEKLLAGVRPMSVAVSAGSLSLEYLAKRKEN